VFLLIAGGTRDQRVAAAAGAIDRGAPGAAPVLLEPLTLPFLREPLPAGPGPRVVVLHDAELAFPDHQDGGVRLVVTQSGYTIQAVLDRLAPGDSLVVTADRDALARRAPEALAGRGPWTGADVIEIGREGSASGPREDSESSSAAARASGGGAPRAVIDEGSASGPREDGASSSDGTIASVLARAYHSSSSDTRLRLCADAAESAPDCEVAALALASACRERQDGDGARKALDRALALAPDWAAAHYEDGKFWLAFDDMPRAAAAFGRASDLMPSFAGAASNLGATLGELDRPEEALAAFQRALAHDPASFTVLNNIGVVTRELGRLDESAEACRRVIALAPEFVFGYYNLGHTRFLAGAYGEALAAYEEGLRRDPEKNRRQRSRLAMVRFATGDVERAAAELWRAASEAPPEEREDLLLEAYEIVAALLARHPEREADRGLLDRIGEAITGSSQS
jgi:tetratricopeptide (TPR) repeat protein